MPNTIVLIRHAQALHNVDNKSHQRRNHSVYILTPDTELYYSGSPAIYPRTGSVSGASIESFGDFWRRARCSNHRKPHDTHNADRVALVRLAGRQRRADPG